MKKIAGLAKTIREFPSGQGYVRESELPFHPHKHFKRDDLQERQDLYRALADEIWDAGKLVEGQG